MTRKLVCWCGEPSLPGRNTCCDEHAFEALRRQRNMDRRCRCGKPARPRKMTCSDECQAEFHGLASNVERIEAPCAVCGNLFLSTARSKRRTCSPDCAAQFAQQSRGPARKCVVCGADCPKGRATCSEDCHDEVRRRQSTVGVRSEQVRAKRRRHAKNEYRRKDKAEVIAKLTSEQGGKCAVCGGEGTALGNGKSGLVLDHDHETGEPRAMLCGMCNAALGMMRESPDLVMSLAMYAERWRSTNATRDALCSLHVESPTVRQPHVCGEDTENPQVEKHLCL